VIAAVKKEVDISSLLEDLYGGNRQRLNANGKIKF
jgi:hypothetical protein